LKNKFQFVSFLLELVYWSLAASTFPLFFKCLLFPTLALNDSLNIVIFFRALEQLEMVVVHGMVGKLSLETLIRAARHCEQFYDLSHAMPMT